MEPLTFVTRDDLIRGGACAGGVDKVIADRGLVVTAMPIADVLRLVSGENKGIVLHAARLDGHGHGYGDGDGRGDGRGDGYGYGYGHGHGYDYGDGDGYSDGNGDGNGYGYGSGSGYGSGYGSGDGYGDDGAADSEAP